MYAVGIRTLALGFTSFEPNNVRSDPCTTDIVGDQVTGVSTADACAFAGIRTAYFMYVSTTVVWITVRTDRRQLLQGAARHVEVSQLALEPRQSHSI